MNIFQRGLMRVAGIGPGLGRLIESAGSVQRAAERITLGARVEESFDTHREQRLAEFREARAIAGGGPRPSGEDPLKERFWELELALEDRGWQRQISLSAMEFSRYGIGQLILMSRLYFIKNPLIKRAVKISAAYVFGRGFEIVGDDGNKNTDGAADPVNEAVQAFLNANEAELGQLGMVTKDESLRTDGNLFFAFFTRQSDGETLVRTIDAVEIIDIVTDPDDASIPKFYKRQWMQAAFDVATGVKTQKPATAWYPALDNGDGLPSTIGGYPVYADTPIYHVKVGGLAKWLWGCPETYASIDWARAYKSFLEDWATITKSLARYSWNVETKGGIQAIANLSAALSSTLANGGTQIETNPPATAGSSFITGPGNKLTPIRTSGATTEPEQGRRVLLMVAAADGLPETFYGDASVGTVATATSLDRPTELAFLLRQQLWKSVLSVICLYAIKRKMTAPRSNLREAIGKRRPQGADGETVSETPFTIAVNFPPVLEHDVKAIAEAVSSAATLDGYQLAGTVDIKTLAYYMLSQVLQVPNAQEIVDEMYPPSSYQREQPDPNEEPEPAPPVPGMMPPGKTPPNPKDVAEAVRIIEEAARRMRRKNR